MNERLGQNRPDKDTKSEVKRHPDGSLTESAVYIDSETGDAVESTKHLYPEGDLDYDTETRTDLGSGEQIGHLTRHYWPGNIIAHRENAFVDRETDEDIRLVEIFYPDGSPRETEETRHRPDVDEDDGDYWLRVWAPGRVLLREAKNRVDTEANQDVLLEKENFPDGQLKSVSEVRLDRATDLTVKTVIESFWLGKLNNAKEEIVNPETGKMVAISRDYRPDGSLRLESGEWTDYNQNELVSWTHHYSDSEALTYGVTTRTDLETGEKQVMPDDYAKLIATQTADQLAGSG